MCLLKCDLSLEMCSPLATNKIKFPYEKYFLLCQRCFWCVSYVGKFEIRECTLCGNIRLDSIPIAYDELCKFDYDTRHGVTLEFMRNPETKGSIKQK